MTLTVTISRIGSTSIDVTARATGGASSYSEYRWLRFWLYDPETEDDTIVELQSDRKGGSSSTWSETFTKCGDAAIQPGRYYQWAARLGEVVNGAIQWSETATDSGTFTTAAAGTPPEPWDWTATEARRNYYDILRGLSPAVTLDAAGRVAKCRLSAAVWNEMCAKVAAMRAHCGYGGWDDGVMPLEEAKMSGSDKALSADRLNALLLNVDEVIYTGLYSVYPGDRVNGRDQIVIMEKCNEALEEG